MPPSKPIRPSHKPPASARLSWPLAIALVLLAFNLRLIFPSLSVLLPGIRQAAGMSAGTAGWLTTLPVLCLGLFAPLAPRCARRFGIERTLLGALLVLAAGTALRGVVGYAGLFVGSALAGGSIAVANVLMPALVKRDFPTRVAGITALYTMALNAGAAVAAATTLPLTHLLQHGWSAGVALWGVPPVVAAAVWMARLGRRPNKSAPAPPRGGLWRSRLAWQVTFFMGLQSATAYCVTGWLAPMLQARGLDGTTAGLVTSVCIIMNVLGSLCVPPLLARFRDQRGVNIALSVVTGGAWLGLLFAPLPSVWFWAVLQGFAQGGMFATALTLIALRAPDAHSAAQLSSMAQTIGYILAACGPLVVGLLLAWTGGFAASGALFVLIALAAALAGWGAGRNRYVSDQPAK